MDIGSKVNVLIPNRTHGEIIARTPIKGDTAFTVRWPDGSTGIYRKEHLAHSVNRLTQAEDAVINAALNFTGVPSLCLRIALHYLRKERSRILGPG